MKKPIKVPTLKERFERLRKIGKELKREKKKIANTNYYKMVCDNNGLEGGYYLKH